MKVLIAALFIAVFSGNALAQVSASVGVGKYQASPVRLYPPPHNHPASPLLYEDFENPLGYDLSGWVETIDAGSIDEDYTGTVLFGSQSCRMVLAADDQTLTLRPVTDSGHVYVSFKLRVQSITGTPDRSILRLRDSGDVSRLRITLNGDGNEVKVWLNGVSATAQGFGISLNTTYTFWAEWNKDNGSDGYANVAFSTTGIRPTSGDNFAEITGGSDSTDINEIMLGSDNDDGQTEIVAIIDHLLINGSQINNFP